ncbi:MAG: ATPase [Ruminococcaceae bacterium]|nr:ATPase [Oscillospiraceae bacterium]
MLIYLVIAVLVALLFAPVVPLVSKTLNGKKAKLSLLCNLASFFSLCIILTVVVFDGSVFAAEGEAVVKALDPSAGMGFLACGIVMAGATLGAGIAVSSAASAAIGATGENPKNFAKSLMFVALGESIPLYALLVVFMIIDKL